MTQIRRIAHRRTITRRSLLGAAGLAVAGGATAALWPNDSPRRTTPQPIAAGKSVHIAARSGSAVELVSDVRALPTTANDITPVAAAQQQFALDLLRVTSSSSNVVLSPSSLATALAMLQLGASGRTRDEIARALHTDHLSSQQQALGWAALTASIARTGLLDSANSVWQQRGFPLQPNYLGQLARYFQAGVWQVDFEHDMTGALSALNRWCATQTHGRITKLFDPSTLDPATTRLVVANAEYFKAAWKYKFDASETHDAPFYRADDSTTRVPFMKSSGPVVLTGNDRYFAAQLPYAGDRFAAQLIMPRSGSLASVISSLTPASLAAMAGAGSGDAAVLIPKFVAHTFTDLAKPLQALGMTTAFADAADFSSLSREPLALEKIVQRDYLKVDEEGTEAAAVTGGGMQIQAAGLTTAFDHPFLFLVRDTQTGTVLFAGQIQDPAAA